MNSKNKANLVEAGSITTCSRTTMGVENTNKSEPIQSSKPRRNKNAYTPTVVLNEIAMKNNLLLEYKTESKTQAAVTHSHLLHETFGTTKKGWETIFSCPHIFTVSLEIHGQKTLYGEGFTQQKARHDAAQKAIEYIRKNLEKLEISSVENKVDDKVETVYPSNAAKLHEVAYTRNLSVFYNVIEEYGKAHLKRFVMEVIAGPLTGEHIEPSDILFKCDAIGNSKKEAKQNAAAKMLKLIKDLPQLVQRNQSKKAKKTSPPSEEKKVIQKVEPLHPVSRLEQIMQIKKKKEPVYTVVQEKDFEEKIYSYTVKCTTCDTDALGTGKSKKDAKKEAANAMLIKLDLFPSMKKIIPNVTMQPKKSSLKTAKDSIGKKHKVKFFDEDGS